jgi:hypothetical protein
VAAPLSDCLGAWLPVQRRLGQQMRGDRCGDEEEEEDRQFVQADAAVVRRAREEDRRGEQHRTDAEGGGLGRAVQTGQEVGQARQPDRAEQDEQCAEHDQDGDG